MICCGKKNQKIVWKNRNVEEPNLIVHTITGKDGRPMRVIFNKFELKIGKYFLLEDIQNHPQRLDSYIRSLEFYEKRISKILSNFLKCNIDFEKNFSYGNAISEKNLYKIFLYSNFDQKYFLKNLTGYQPPLDERWNFWQVCVIKVDFLNKKTFDFEAKNKDKTHSRTLETIMKDVPRTFSDQNFFSKKKLKFSLGEISLFKVSKVVSIRVKEIGYCQGLNFVLGFLLQISGGKESEVANLTLNLMLNTKFLIAGFYDDEFPMVSFLKYFVKKNLEKKIPDLLEHMENMELLDDLWVSKWILCMMTTYLPRYHVARLLDFVLCRDIFAFGSYVSALLFMIKDFLLDKDLDQLNEILNKLESDYEFILPEAEKIAKLAEKKFMWGRRELTAVLNEYVREEKGYGREEFVKRYFPFLNEYLTLGEGRVMLKQEFLFDRGDRGDLEVDGNRFFRFRN